MDDVRLPTSSVLRRDLLDIADNLEGMSLSTIKMLRETVERVERAERVETIERVVESVKLDDETPPTPKSDWKEILRYTFLGWWLYSSSGESNLDQIE